MGEKTHKHMGEKTHQQNAPKIPGQSREMFAYVSCLYVVFFMLPLFQDRRLFLANFLL